MRFLLKTFLIGCVNEKTSTKLIVKAISYNKEYYFLKDLIRAALPVKARK